MKKLIALVVLAMVPGVAWGAAHVEVLRQRAVQFKELGLMDLTREQYLFIQHVHPQEKDIAAALAELSQQESQIHLNNAIAARKHGALKLALYELERAARANPSDTKLKSMHRDIEKQLALKTALNQRVSKDYLEGLDHFQALRYDRALESFVKVLNMAPDHTGAARYVHRIGEKMGVPGK